MFGFEYQYCTTFNSDIKSISKICLCKNSSSLFKYFGCMCGVVAKVVPLPSHIALFVVGSIATQNIFFRQLYFCKIICLEFILLESKLVSILKYAPHVHSIFIVLFFIQRFYFTFIYTSLQRKAYSTYPKRPVPSSQFFYNSLGNARLRFPNRQLTRYPLVR